MKSTRGGRYLARERDAAEGRVVESDVPPMIHPPLRGPVIERLSMSSIQALCSFFGWSLSEMQKRYERFA